MKGAKRGPRSEETKTRISVAQRGRDVPEERRLRIAASLRGKKQGPRSEEAKRHMSEARRGMRFSDQARANMSAGQRGTKKSLWSPDAPGRVRLSVARLGIKRPDLSGPNCNFWKGGTYESTATEIRLAAPEFRRNRRLAYARDRGICQLCGERCTDRTSKDATRRGACHHTGDPHDHQLSKLEILCVSCHGFLHSQQYLMPWHSAMQVGIS